MFRLRSRAEGIQEEESKQVAAFLKKSGAKNFY
jgi:hypothetical protein